MADSWIDVSVPLHDGMVHWPDNPPVSIQRTMSMERGDVCNVTKMSLGVHTGTHMDAPIHWIPDGAGMDAMPPDATIGPARVIAIQDTVSIKPEELRPHDIQRGERVLFKTRNSERCWTTDAFVEDFVFISHEAAHYLIESGIRTVGVDYLSVGGYTMDGPETHRALLEAGIWIIEGLNLSPVTPGAYELICLPLRIAGADGAPARALLRPL